MPTYNWGKDLTTFNTCLSQLNEYTLQNDIYWEHDEKGRVSLEALWLDYHHESMQGSFGANTLIIVFYSLCTERSMSLHYSAWVWKQNILLKEIEISHAILQQNLTAVIMKLPPEVLVERCSSRQILYVLFLPDCWPTEKLQASFPCFPSNTGSMATTLELVSCVQLSEMDAHCSVNTQ